MRVLVGEDETLIRIDLKAMLERAGYEVCAEALASSTESVPVKAIAPAAPDTYAGAKKPSAAPSSGVPVVGTPRRRAACRW